MGSAYTYCLPTSSHWRVSFKRLSKKRHKMTFNFNELPKKALQLIFENLGQVERQKQRLVCRRWNTFILEEFPVELVITQGNYERLFRCPHAVTVEIQSLTAEFTGNVGFGSRVRTMLFTGKVLSSNLCSILRSCPDLEKLQFSSLKNVLGIEGVESVKLPKLHTIGIKVRPDQETFTADEIIIIGVLREIIYGSFKTILIETKATYEEDENGMEEEEEENGTSESSSVRINTEDESKGFSVSMFSSESIESGGVTTTQQLKSVAEEIGEPGPGSQQGRAVPQEEENLPSGNVGATEASRSQSTGTQTSAATQTQTLNTNLNVIINRAANFANASGSNAATVTTSSHASTASSTRRVRYNISEFEARLFYANLEIITEGLAADTNVLNILNDSRSRTRIDSAAFLDLPGGGTIPALKHTVFFELVRNNCATLKNFVVKTRADFSCFGNLTSFARDLHKVQFEEVDYSFGRMQLCQEHLLLREQRNLQKIRMQVLDDMCKHVMFAIENCQSKLEEIDLKILSVGEDTIDMSPIMGCQHLKSLRLLHFYDKGPLALLPRTLNKLLINGPLTYDDMTAWTVNLRELTDLTLLLNVRGDEIDLKLYKKFIKLPKMSRLTFIQCPMTLLEIQRYYESTLKGLKGIHFWYTGPVEVRDVPSIQYVYTLINPDEFDREQVRIEE